MRVPVDNCLLISMAGVHFDRPNFRWFGIAVNLETLSICFGTAALDWWQNTQSTISTFTGNALYKMLVYLFFPV